MGWKTLFFLALLIAGGIGYFLWGKVEQAPPAATLPGYVNALKNDELKAQSVAAGANLEGVRSAVEKYKADRGSLPSSLQDLVPQYLDHVPGGLQYDPATGNVSAAP
jgi:hypothetical protein